MMRRRRCGSCSPCARTFCIGWREERHFIAEVTRGLCFLLPMGRDGLRAALTRPLLAAGYRFENEAMVEAMVGGLEQTKSPLPLLQFTAAKLRLGRAAIAIAGPGAYR